LEFLKIQKKLHAILCGQICPEVFVVTDQSGIIEGVSFEDYELQIKEAAECCQPGSGYPETAGVIYNV